MRQPVPFGKYLLLDRISVGGMAEVFKAKSYGVEGFEKIIAIKRILPTMGEDRDFIKMFIDEAKIAGQLAHANICQIFELGRIDGSHFIAMEYIWGKDLLQIQNRLRKLKQPMPIAMACFMIAKTLEGLDYAHRKRDPLGRPLEIVHRDCSPQNVLVSYEGEVKVIDFGIAKATSRNSRTMAGVLKGKFGYMSPEQVRGLPLDRRSDLFALGTMLFECLTSERLFQGETDFSTLEKVRNVDIPQPRALNPNIPEHVERVILKALAKDVDDRYQWCSEMLADLQQYLMSQDVVFTAKSLSSWLKEMFQPEIERERGMLEQYKRLGRDGLINNMPAAEAQQKMDLVEHLGAADAPDEGATQLGTSFDEEELVALASGQAVKKKRDDDSADFEHEAPTEIFGEDGSIAPPPVPSPPPPPPLPVLAPPNKPNATVVSPGMPMGNGARGGPTPRPQIQVPNAASRGQPQSLPPAGPVSAQFPHASPQSVAHNVQEVSQLPMAQAPVGPQFGARPPAHTPAMLATPQPSQQLPSVTPPQQQHAQQSLPPPPAPYANSASPIQPIQPYAPPAQSYDQNGYPQPQPQPYGYPPYGQGSGPQQAYGQQNPYGQQPQYGQPDGQYGQPDGGNHTPPPQQQLAAMIDQSVGYGGYPQQAQYDPYAQQQQPYGGYPMAPPSGPGYTPAPGVPVAMPGSSSEPSLVPQDPAALQVPPGTALAPRSTLVRDIVIGVVIAAVALGIVLGVKIFFLDSDDTEVPQPTPSAFATVHISLPPGVTADLVVDGKKIAVVSDNQEIALQPGQRHIQLVGAGNQCEATVPLVANSATPLKCQIQAGKSNGSAAAGSAAAGSAAAGSAAAGSAAAGSAAAGSADKP